MSASLLTMQITQLLGKMLVSLPTFLTMRFLEQKLASSQMMLGTTAVGLIQVFQDWQSRAAVNLALSQLATSVIRMLSSPVISVVLHVGMSVHLETILYDSSAATRLWHVAGMHRSRAGALGQLLLTQETRKTSHRIWPAHKPFNLWTLCLTSTQACTTQVPTTVLYTWGSLHKIYKRSCRNWRSR